MLSVDWGSPLITYVIARNESTPNCKGIDDRTS